MSTSILEKIKNAVNPNRKASMRLSHVISEVYYKPMLITDTGHTSIRNVIESKLANDYVKSFRVESPEDDPSEYTDMFGEPLDGPYNLDEAGTIRIIPIYGIIGNKVSLMERTCGVCDCKELREWVISAAEDANVSTIIFDIDSPGGSVSGVPELADMISIVNKKKKCIAFTDGLMCSAAYWIASSCSEIYCSKSSEVGSIGVYCYILDVTAAYEEEGIRVEMFKDGKFKGMGTPGVPLTDEQRTFMQDDVNKVSVMFKEFVREYRPSVNDETMQGQSFMGKDAVNVGLCDAVIDDISGIIVK